MIKIVNQTKWPVWLTLTSGATLRLAPGGVSAMLNDVEVKNNPKIDKLQARRVITVQKMEEAPPEETRAPAGEKTHVYAAKKSRSAKSKALS